MRPPLPASRLSEAYEVQEVVRQGGLSTTLRVRHRGSGELRCIDVLRPAPGPRDVLERRLDAEARPLMELRHPQVARLVDAAVGEAGEACIVRENHEGVTLRRLTGSQRPSLPLAVELLRQAADGLAYLHFKGRRVGDLSPEGILVGRGPSGGPHLVLADLGLAKDWQEEAALTAAGLFIGRLRYAAPEQFEAQGKQAAPGDVYALGLVAYELLTGRHPIAGDSASSLIAGHLFRSPTEFAETDPEGQVPEDLRRLVLSALTKRPDERPPASEIRSGLEQIQASLPAPDASELHRWIDPPQAAQPDPVAESQDETQQLEAWLEEAHSLARDEQFLEARDKVRQVLKVQPDHSMGLMLLASLEACLKIQVEESKSHQTLRLPAETVRPLEGGSQTVMLPTRRPPRSEDIRTADSRTEDARAVGSQTVRVMPADITQVVAAASAAQGAGSQEPGAPSSTERLDLDALDDGKTRPLSPELLRRISDSEPPNVSPAQFADGTTKLLDTRPEVAERSESQPGPEPTSELGPESEPEFEPDSEPELETALPLPGTVTMPMEQIEKQKQSALASMAAPSPAPQPAPYSDPTLPSLPAMPEVRRPAEVPASVAFPASFAETGSEPQSYFEPTPTPQSRPAPLEAAAPVVAAPVVAAPLAAGQETAASVDDLGFGGPSRSPVVERHTRGRGRQAAARGRRPSRDTRPSRGSRSSRSRSAGGMLILIGSAVAAALVFAIGYAVAAGIDLRELVGLGSTKDVVTPSELPPVAAAPGLLVLDAQPWAEIVQIIDPLGEDVPLRFRHTPARYEVAPGTYTVILSSPTGARETLELEVASEQTTQARPELGKTSVDDYFRLMGWR